MSEPLCRATPPCHRAQPAFWILGVWLLAAGTAQAMPWPLPPPGEHLVGEIRTVTANHEDSLLDIARRHNLGYQEIRRANPGLDAWMPGEGVQVVLPNRHLLPQAPREGIVLNTAEMRLYHFPGPAADGDARVVTYPVSIGRGEWQTPVTTTRVIAKTENPTWTPTESIRAEHEADGRTLPASIPPGPGNPLGRHALRLGLTSYLIHGTNRPYGIGMQVTHGCIRMYPEDIERLFGDVAVGTPVHIVYQPYKLGWSGDTLYMQAYPHLDGRKPDGTAMIRALVAATEGLSGVVIDWERVRALLSDPDGMPVPVGRRAG